MRDRRKSYKEAQWVRNHLRAREMRTNRFSAIWEMARDAVAKIIPTPTTRKRGRPRIQLSEEQMAVLLSGGQSVRERALRLGISKDITWRRLKEAQAQYA